MSIAAADFQFKITIKDLLEAGTHLGHQTHRWDPRMKQYIFEVHNGLHIIDLSKTIQQLRNACKIVRDAISRHQNVLFVGTKKQAKVLIEETAKATGEFYVSERWLGGMLTNLKTIRQSIKKLEKIEKQIATSGAQLTKKELSQLTKEHVKLSKNLNGIRNMRRLPGLIIVVDPKLEHLAITEANVLGIPILALTDTNCNPEPIDHVVAGNDDATRSIQIILDTLSQAILHQKQEMNLALSKGESEEGKA
jgi:small subunit ribosomal protein S2